MRRSRGRRPTVRDVAAMAGVSVSTVSRVLHDHPDVGAETRTRVLAAVTELHYRPSLVARSMVTNSSLSIGLLIADVTNPFYPELIKGVDDAASARDHIVIVGNTEHEGGRASALVEALLERSVDGLIFGSVRTDDCVVAGLVAEGFPLVLVNRRIPGVEANLVTVDNELGARMATEHLIRMGHRSVAFIAGESWASNSLDRRAGYMAALRDAGIALSEDWIVESDFSTGGGNAAMVRLLSLEERPTAVFCSNDSMALGALEAIATSGLKCPQDVAVVGFDDIPLARSRLVGLTSISFDAYRTGLLAAETLFRHIDGSTAEFRSLILPPTLHVRRTCGGNLSY